MSNRLREKDLLEEIDRLKTIIRELEHSKEYGLVWNRQKYQEEFEVESRDALPVLAAKTGRRKSFVLNASEDHNVLIEGDNYHSLSVLAYTHAGRVDVIYIDPPYNTGNRDFRFNDSYVERDDAYRHSKWLSFMERRLRLAADLLARTGMIFISIDDNEQAQLKLLCDAIFREANHIATLVWENKEGGGGSDSQFFRIKHEYVLVYARDIVHARIAGLPVEDEDRYRFTDNHAKERGPYQLIKLDSASLGYVATLDFPIEAPDGSQVRPNRSGQKVSRWRWSREKVAWGRANDFLVFKKSRRGEWGVYTKQYLYCDSDGNLRPRTIQPLAVISGYSTTQSNRAIKDIFGDVTFKYSKPVEFIEHLLRIATSKTALVLDFFAGSGTTGQATMALNQTDGGSRRFILCTNNENAICEEVTYERLTRVMRGYTAAGGRKVPSLGGNLVYLKTDFVKKELPLGLSDEAKLKLTRRANLIIALRENTFTSLAATHHYELFGSPSRITGIYFTFDKSNLTAMLDTLVKSAAGREVVVYIFEWEKGAYKAGIPGYPFRFEDIPEPLIEVYQSIGL